MHALDIFHEHLAMSDEERATIAQYIWDQENVELSTIGIDIGSSTSHLLFAKVLLQRQSQGLSSRFAVVHRQVVWRSPIMLTPFLPDGAIDAGKLGRSMSCSPPRPANSSALPPGISSNRRSPPTARAPSGCRGSAVRASCTSTSAAAPPSLP